MQGGKNQGPEIHAYFTKLPDEGKAQPDGTVIKYVGAQVESAWVAPSWERTAVRLRSAAAQLASPSASHAAAHQVRTMAAAELKAMVDKQAAKEGGKGRSLYKLYANLLQDEKPDGYKDLRMAFNQEAKQAKPAAETEVSLAAARLPPPPSPSRRSGYLQPVCEPASRPQPLPSLCALQTAACRRPRPTPRLCFETTTSAPRASTRSGRKAPTA